MTKQRFINILYMKFVNDVKYYFCQQIRLGNLMEDVVFYRSRTQDI